jgi:hypothetical protein
LSCVFTRCDVVGTWSREYQLSSYSNYFLILSFNCFYYCTIATTFWQFFENLFIFFWLFLTIFWQLFVNFWQLFDNFLTTFYNFWHLFDIYLKTFWHFFDIFLTKNVAFFILMVLASCSNKYYCVLEERVNHGIALSSGKRRGWPEEEARSWHHPFPVPMNL